MAIDFPNTPFLNQTYTYSGRTWYWNGVSWKAVGTAQGVTGFQGIQGLQGPQGLQGIQGDLGIGVQGIQGNQGPNAAITFDANPPVSPLLGDRWVDSNSGIEYTYLFDGTNYSWVEVSASGFAGVQGLTGIQGSQGLQGLQGLDGAFAGQGVQGTQGNLGNQGIQGSNAIMQGTQGPQGLLGFQGIANQGVQGIQGFTGLQGYDTTVNVSSPITNSGTTTAAVIGIPASTTSVVGAVQLEDSVSSTSVTKAATPNSVRTAYVLGSGFLANYQTKVGQTSSTIDVPDRYNVLHSYNGYSGYITFSFFTPLETMTISQITMGNSSIPAASCTAARMGLYTFDGTTATLVARTADDTTLFNSLYTSYTRSFSTTGGYPASYTLTAGSRYAFAYIVVAATMPTIYNAPLGDNNAGVIGALSPRISGVRTGQTDLLVSTTINGPSDQVPWFRGS